MSMAYVLWSLQWQLSLRISFPALIVGLVTLKASLKNPDSAIALLQCNSLMIPNMV